MIKKSILNVALLFLPIIFYPPFFFDRAVSAPLRIALYVQLILYLFYKSRHKIINSIDIQFSLFLLSYFVLMLLSAAESYQSLFTIGNYCLTILFAWALTRHLEKNKTYKSALSQVYIGFSYLNVGLAVASLVYYSIAGEFDIFGFKSDEYLHKVTPFGILFPKAFGEFTVLRACSYFNEPSYAGIFFALNMGLLAPRLGSNVKKFKTINGLGGILTFSLSFYMLLLILHVVSQFEVKGLKAIISQPVLIVLGVTALLFGDLDYTSATDRLNRASAFYEIVEYSSLSTLLVGHGIGTPLELSKGISSGLLIWVSEVGLLGALGIILFTCTQYKKPLNVAAFLALSLIINPLPMPFFWIIFIMSYLTYNSSQGYK